MVLREYANDVDIFSLTSPDPFECMRNVRSMTFVKIPACLLTARFEFDSCYCLWCFGCGNEKCKNGFKLRLPNENN